MHPEEKAAWRAAVELGDTLADHDCPGAIAAWSRALAMDDGYADLHYRIARCEHELGRLDDAERQFRLASDLDRLPQGASTSFNDLVRDVARRESALLVDIDALFTRTSGPRLVSTASSPTNPI